MVSRFAPTDMLLQRFGRLWRHEHTPRPRSAVCEAWVLAPDLHYATGAPEKAFGNSAFVYSPFVLCRSLEVWQAAVNIQLPTDIRSLIERTYAIRDESTELAGMLADLDNGTRWRTGRKAMRQLARITLADAGNTLPESKAQTRYSETDSFDVLLLRHIKLVPEDKVTRITLLNGEQHSLPWHQHVYSKAQWRKLSATLMRQVVALRIQDAPLQIPLQMLQRFRLQYCFYLGNPAHEEAILRVALVDETGRLSGVQGAPLHDKYSLNYRDDLGYRVIKS
jgi:CRISPR-associated endonuclease/helicase Cas3